MIDGEQQYAKYGCMRRTKQTHGKKWRCANKIQIRNVVDLFNLSWVHRYILSLLSLFLRLT